MTLALCEIEFQLVMVCYDFCYVGAVVGAAPVVVDVASAAPPRPPCSSCKTASSTRVRLGETACDT